MQKQFDETNQKANDGDVEAQYQLGIIYSKGNEIVVRDLEKAFQWFGKAAKQGHSHARGELEKIADAMQTKLEKLSDTENPSK